MTVVCLKIYGQNINSSKFDRMLSYIKKELPRMAVLFVSLFANIS